MENYLRKVLKNGLPVQVEKPLKLLSDGEQESCSESETEYMDWEDDSSVASLRSPFDEAITHTSDKFNFYRQNSLSTFLLQKETLNKALQKEDCGSPPRCLRTDWVSHYTTAVSEKSADEEEHWKWILGMMVYTKRVPLEQVANLQCIATLSAEYRRYARRYAFDGEELFEKPAYDYMHEADNPADSYFDATKIAAIFTKHVNPFVEKSTSQSSKIKKKREEAKEKYYTQVDQDSFKLAEYAKQFWPCDTIRYMPWEEIEKSLTFGVQNYSMDRVITEVDHQLQLWHKNFKFREFVETIQQKLDAAYDDYLNLVTNEKNPACQPEPEPTTSTKTEVQ